MASTSKYTASGARPYIPGACMLWIVISAKYLRPLISAQSASGAGNRAILAKKTSFERQFLKFVK